jgi:hypothetical protein
MVNRESLPLIVGLILPIILVISIILYLYGFDLTYFFRKIDFIYYVIIIPIGLGFSAGIIKHMKAI